MYNTVKYEANCWKCQKPLHDFQSKDGDRSLSELMPKQVQRFYTSCDYCHAWSEFKVIPKEIEIVLDEIESKLRTA